MTSELPAKNVEKKSFPKCESILMLSINIATYNFNMYKILGSPRIVKKRNLLGLSQTSKYYNCIVVAIQRYEIK